MRVTIEHRCGHQHRHTYYSGERGTVRRKLASVDCPRCVKRFQINRWLKATGKRG